MGPRLLGQLLSTKVGLWCKRRKDEILGSLRRIGVHVVDPE